MNARCLFSAPLKFFPSSRLWTFLEFYSYLAYLGPRKKEISLAISLLSGLLFDESSRSLSLTLSLFLSEGRLGSRFSPNERRFIGRTDWSGQLIKPWFVVRQQTAGHRTPSSCRFFQRDVQGVLYSVKTEIEQRGNMHVSVTRKLPRYTQAIVKRRRTIIDFRIINKKTCVHFDWSICIETRTSQKFRRNRREILKILKVLQIYEKSCSFQREVSTHLAYLYRCFPNTLGHISFFFFFFRRWHQRGFERHDFFTSVSSYRMEPLSNPLEKFGEKVLVYEASRMQKSRVCVFLFIGKINFCRFSWHIKTI